MSIESKHQQKHYQSEVCLCTLNHPLKFLHQPAQRFLLKRKSQYQKSAKILLLNPSSKKNPNKNRTSLRIRQNARDSASTSKDTKHLFMFDTQKHKDLSRRLQENSLIFHENYTQRQRDKDQLKQNKEFEYSKPIIQRKQRSILFHYQNKQTPLNLQENQKIYTPTNIVNFNRDMYPVEKKQENLNDRSLRVIVDLNNRKKFQSIFESQLKSEFENKCDQTKQSTNINDLSTLNSPFMSTHLPQTWPIQQLTFRQVESIRDDESEECSEVISNLTERSIQDGNRDTSVKRLEDLIRSRRGK